MLRKPDNVDARQWSKYLRARERCPLFADDPAMVPLPRTIQEQAAFRERCRSDLRRRFRAMEAQALWASRRYLRLLRAARVPGADVWAAIRVVVVMDLGAEYLADALRRLCRRVGLEV